MRERSIGELTKKLPRDVSNLVRKELELARTEIAAKVRSIALGAGAAAVGVVLLVVTIGVLAAAAVMALDAALPGWLAALIVAGCAGLAGGLLVLVGIRSIRGSVPVPAETVDSIKEDVRWAKTRAKSGAR